MMQDEQSEFDKLGSHRFPSRAMQSGLEIIKQASPDGLAAAAPEFERELDKREYYLLDVSTTIAHLLILCQQLDHTVLYLSAFSPTDRMKRSGINRANQLQYTIENFLIRVPALYDRVLQLTNAVFFLGLHPKHCRHDTIIRNAHVAATDIPETLKSLYRLTAGYRQDRNTVIHRRSYVADDLRTLELFHMEFVQNKVEKENLPYVTSYLTREIVQDRSKEYKGFNSEIFGQLILLFDALEAKYDVMIFQFDTE